MTQQRELLQLSQSEIHQWIKENIPCQTHCPFNIDIALALEFLSNEEYANAYRTFLWDNPFPGITGRICLAPCEFACKRRRIDHPVSIKKTEEYICEVNAEGSPIVGQPIDKSMLEPRHPRKKKIGIIGGGPAGLSAAYFLNLWEYDVTVIDKREQPGGRLLYLPNFVLPPEQVAYEIQRIFDMGVRFQPRHNVSLFELKTKLLTEYDALLITVSPTLTFSSSLLESSNERVFSGIDLLESMNEDELPEFGDHVVVLGGSPVASWCARYAKRLGAKQVEIFFQENKLRMTIPEDEQRELAEEGVHFNYLYTPIRLVTMGSRIEGIKFVKNKLLGADEDGIQRSTPQYNQEIMYRCDTVIFADLATHYDLNIARQNRHNELSFALERLENSRFATKIQGVFSYNEIKDSDIDFPNMVRPMADGKKMAYTIHEYLCEQDPINQHEIKAASYALQKTVLPKTSRTEASTKIRTQYIHNSEGVSAQPLTAEEATQAARECIRCHYRVIHEDATMENCLQCRICDDVCPETVFAFETQESIDPEKQLHKSLGSFLSKVWSHVLVSSRKKNPISLYPKISHPTECIRCFHCVVECPTSMYGLEKLTYKQPGWDSQWENKRA
jgi:NADPH-dependent glutamate synthase beta subunit-like oxidoreductase/ferredoxin